MDYWSYKSCKSSPPTNQHPVFCRPDALPVAQPTVSKHWRNNYHIPWTCWLQAHLGVFQLCLWPLIAPCNLGVGLPCLSSAIWCQHPTLGSMDYIYTTQVIAIGHIYCNVVITDGLCAHLWHHATRVCEWNVSWKVLENEFVESWKTPEFGLCNSWKVLKNWDLNVCTNPVQSFALDIFWTILCWVAGNNYTSQWWCSVAHIKTQWPSC